MTDAACYVIGLIALLIAAHIMRTKRIGIAGPAYRHAGGFALCLGLGTVLVAPTSVVVLQYVQPYPGLGILLGDDTTLLAMHFLSAFALAIRDGSRERGLSVRPALATSAVMVVNAALFFGAGSQGAQDGYFAGTDARAAMAAYDSVFMLYCFWGAGIFLVCCKHYTARVEPGMLRTGLHLCSASAVVGFLWAGWAVSDIVDVLRTGQQGAPEDTPAAVLGALCAGLALSGVTIATWAAQMAAWGRWWRSYRAMRRLGPLWHAAREAVPQVVLGRSGRIAGAVPRDARFGLYRRVIEIRDAQLALRRHCPPMRIMARIHGVDPGSASVLDDQPPAVAEAADLAVAMLAAHLGRVFDGEARAPRGGHGPAAGSGAEGGGGGGAGAGRRSALDAETAWLIEVSDAFAHSPEVARIRRRARDILREAVDEPAGRGR